MNRLFLATAMVVCLTALTFGQKDSNSKRPVVDQTQSQMDERASAAKRRTGKSVDPSRIGTPVADPQHRKRVLCRQYGPEEWNLIFPDIPSEYGGTVCVRK